MNIIGILYEYYRNIIGILYEYYRNIAECLSNCCELFLNI